LSVAWRLYSARVPWTYLLNDSKWGEDACAVNCP